MDIQVEPIVVSREPDGAFKAVVVGAIHTNTAWLESEFKKIVAAKPQRVLLDLGGTTFMSSTGIGVLVAFHRGITEAGGVVKITAIQKNVYGSLKFACLDKLFAIEPSAILLPKKA